MIAGSVQCASPVEEGVLTPEMFGAKGDGRSNDTAAFRRLSAAVARRGGGTIALRPVVYLVGEQSRTGGSAFEPSPILSFDGLPGPLTIRGSGATLRCAPGLRYGSFDPATGLPHKHAMPFADPSTRATPYHFMIAVERCAGAVEIADIELDGNAGRQRIGGPYGDVGIQIAATGILLRDNRGPEILRRIHSHHHCQDGLLIDGLSERGGTTPPRIADRVRCEDNGRQGCSLVGGRGWTFTGCAFNRSGRGGVMSPPGAGFDIEAEGAKINRNHRFVDCEFVDNAGAGMVADSGDSASATLTRCRFVGTTSPSLWPNKPGFSFVDCRVVGTVVRCFGSPDPRAATRFLRCTFTDAAALSPTSRVYRQDRANGSLADLSDSENVLFDRCRFLAVGGAVLPWSTRAIYRDCVMRQRGRSPAYPRGTFLGDNVIDGPVDLGSSAIRGPLRLNGRAIAP